MDVFSHNTNSIINLRLQSAYHFAVGRWVNQKACQLGKRGAVAKYNLSVSLLKAEALVGEKGSSGARMGPGIN